MSDNKEAKPPHVGGEAPAQRTPGTQTHSTEHLESIPSHTVTHQEQEKADACLDIDHVANLGLENWKDLEKKVVRRLDMTMLPQLWILYMFNYLNRVNIAQARLNTFDEDLGLEDGDYQTAVAILTVGYMLAQLPSNMLITRVRPAVYLPTAAMLWSAISAATAGCTSAGGLLGVQFVLGIIEAPLFPGAVFLMSCWYTRRELALRTALLYSGLVLAQAFSGLIAAGVFAGLDGAMNLAGWQWLFILEGAASAFFALTAFFILPNYPQSENGSAMWSMTSDMRKVAVARILDDRVEKSEGLSVWHGLKLAVTDVKCYIFIFMNIFITSSYGFNNFFPTMVRGFNLGSDNVSLLLTAPPYVWGTIVSFLVAWSSDRKRERGFHIMANLGCSITGFIITVATVNTAARYTAAFLYTSGSFSANALVYTWAVSSLGQTPEKRAAGGAIVNICGHIGNVISPYFFPDRDAPRFTMAMILQIVFASLALTMAGVSKMYLRKQNSKLRESAERLGRAYNPFTT
ncbi:hypothetical protein BN1723_010706 [Verticillium longisporum]|uniref:Major facilitator superfamily (MFS) profile domain-containing protein n=1 Tax=Verticillium longisporum TaxID=100787 RepID=A0A0G4M370_VERLO|nr:Major facilitator-type transporter hxnP like protein [Verticillium longisporum]CRK15550.1 hypothetical protein BN1723_010706 [Verticillium longisporum]CRK28724.1 hypothetical protein BN1708_004707 [Verticillium longisporum]